MNLIKRLALVLALLLAPAAWADGLIENVNGITLDEHGQVVRFTGLMFNRDGKVTHLYLKDERRPKAKVFEWVIDMGGKHG